MKTGEAYAEFSGRRIWFRDGGAGVPVVFLHSRTGSSLVWEHQVAAFGAAGYRFIAYDRLGHGRSVLKTGAEPGTAADDLEGLMRYLGIGEFHLVGTAAGGIVAFDYALSFASRLRSLVIANSIGGVQDEDYLALHQRLRPPQFAALPPELRELGPAYRAANAQGEARWIELEQAGHSRHACEQTMRNRISFASLETITAPTLLMTGDADLYTPPPVLKLFAARIKRSQFLVIDECGHSAYWEQPEAFNRAVLGFIHQH
ncbi:MAG TPA: alpha/beta hydrolase [Burkholderiales bacterium]|nr:alpha/beta hydrolase [Burkholderiales bacterium]